LLFQPTSSGQPVTRFAVGTQQTVAMMLPGNPRGRSLLTQSEESLDDPKVS